MRSELVRLTKISVEFVGISARRFEFFSCKYILSSHPVLSIWYLYSCNHFSCSTLFNVLIVQSQPAWPSLKGESAEVARLHLNSPKIMSHCVSFSIHISVIYKPAGIPWRNPRVRLWRNPKFTRGEIHAFTRAEFHGFARAFRST